MDFAVALKNLHLNNIKKIEKVRVEWFFREKMDTRQVVQTIFKDPHPNSKFHFFMLLFNLVQVFSKLLWLP